MASGSRHAAPVKVLADHSVVPLVRLNLGQSEADGGRREAFIQGLVHDHPETLPMADIEPAFSPLISVCKELPTPAGYVDNVWVTPSGGLILGECKLVRNPEARREVVAQSLDYARAIGAWTYDDLQRGVRAARRQADFKLWSLVEDATDLEEAQFVDAVERRLRTGRLLILIIGDGIQEGVEALTEHLQMHAGIHAGMALVDLSIWSDPSGDLLVVPRVPMRTVLIERGVVTFNPAAGIQVTPPLTAVTSPTSKPRAVTASEPEFYAQLDERRPGLSPRLRAFLDSVAGMGVTPEFRASLVFRWSVSPDAEGRAGYVEKTGKIWSQSAAATANRLGRPEAGEKYLEAIARAIGGSIRHYQASPPEVVGADGRGLDLAALLDHADEWRQALAELIEALRPSDD